MDFPAGVMVKLCCVIMGGGTMNDGDFSFDVMEDINMTSVVTGLASAGANALLKSF